MTTMSSRAPAAATAGRRGGETTDHLWEKAAELERDFAGYKRRLAERRAQAAAAAVVAGGHAGEEVCRDGDADAGGKGRRYEEYVRKRDERLRNEWRARMERKEAEMQALWTRLDRTGSRGRLAGDGDGELAATSHVREDHGDLRQKPRKLPEVKVKPPPVPVTPRSGAATKLSRPRTSMSSSSPAPASPSPRLSTPDPRRRPLHSPPAEPLATPRKENRLPPPASTPRPRTMLSRSRSMLKDHGSSSLPVRESPRPPRNQPPRSSFDSGSNIKELPPALPIHAGAIAVMRKSSSCSSGKAVVAELMKASGIASEPFHPRRSGNVNVIELASSPPLVISRDEHDSSSEIAAPAGDGNADSKSKHEHVEQSSDKLGTMPLNSRKSSDKFGSVVITGDSDTEPNYVYIKKDRDEQTPRPCQTTPADLGTCPGGETRSSDNEDIDNVDDTMESTDSNDVSGETPVTDTEEASRRESSESLYSNVQSSFSPTSELDTSATESPALPSATEQSPESDASPRPRKKAEVEDTEKSIPIPTTPRSSVTLQSPMDAVAGLKRLLTFGKKNSKGSDSCMSGDWPAGDSMKARLDSSDVASADDLDNSYVISPHVGSLQSSVPSELKGPVLHAKSPRVHRSFFSFPSFKSRAN